MSNEEKTTVMRLALKANPDISIGEYNELCSMLDAMSNRAKQLFWENYNK